MVMARCWQDRNGDDWGAGRTRLLIAGKLSGQDW